MDLRNLIFRLAAGVALGLGGLWALLPTIATALRAGTNAEAGPIAEFDRTDWNFGKCPPSASLEASIRVHNRGNQRLILHKLNGDCDCLAGAGDEVVLEPGAVFVLKPRLYSAHAAGRLQAQISYRTNDVRQPLVKLTLTAEIDAT
jgi:hypothetical protein